MWVAYLHVQVAALESSPDILKSYDASAAKSYVKKLKTVKKNGRIRLNSKLSSSSRGGSVVVNSLSVSDRELINYERQSSDESDDAKLADGGFYESGDE